MVSEYQTYSRDLNNELVQYSENGDLFYCQRVSYSDARYHGSVIQSTFRLTGWNLDSQSAIQIQIPGTMLKHGISRIPI